MASAIVDIMAQNSPDAKGGDDYKRKFWVHLMILADWQLDVDVPYEITPEETVERQVIAKREYEELRALMDAEDIRIAQALEAKVLFGYSVKKIAQDLGVSEPRVYQLIARAKAMGKEYRKANSNE